MDAAWVFVAIAAGVVLVALFVFLVPPRRDGGAPAPTTPGQGAPTSSGALVRGFSYLQGSSRSSVRRGGVHSRLERAFRRIDAVDPHAAPRRVGEALLQVGPPEPAPGPPAPGTPISQPATLWVEQPVPPRRDTP